MQGKDNHTICEELSISVNTLKKHILNIYRKLGIRNRVQMFKMIKEKEWFFYIENLMDIFALPEEEADNLLRGGKEQ